MPVSPSNLVCVQLNRFALIAALVPASLSLACGSAPSARPPNAPAISASMALLNTPMLDGVALLRITPPHVTVLGATLLLDGKVTRELGELPEHLMVPLTGVPVGEHRFELHVLTEVGLVKNAIRFTISAPSADGGHQA